MLRELTLDAADLDRLYPYHLVIDAQMRVVGAGAVLRRLLPELSTAPLLDDVFAIERPQDIGDFASLCESRESTFLLRAHANKEVKLKGGVLPVPSGQHAVLLTVLWFTDSAALDRLNLGISDFAQSDTSPDFIFLVETQAALLRDAKLSAERLRVARDEAMSASRMKSEFLANMSHELRTPLNAIIGFSEYMTAVHADALPAKCLEYTRDIHASGTFLLDIINDLLDLSRIEAGKLVLEEGPVDLGILARETINAVDGHVREKSLAIALEGFESPVSVRADRRLMRQILLNLVSNAAKFNRPTGSIAISVERMASGGLSIAVADTGIGIDPKVIPELFQPFRQANSRIAREYGGTGLGLAIVRQLARLHGGDAEMQSTPGVGTTVSITLPRDRVLEAAPVTPAAPPAEKVVRLVVRAARR